MPTRNCYFVEAPGGRSSDAPCGSTGVCGPLDVDAWNEAAAAWVRTVELEARTPDQRTWAAQMRARYDFLNADIPAPWSIGDRVHDYMTICQQISCALQPIWEQRVRERGVVTTNGGGGGGTNGGEEEDSWWSWLPDMPSLPSWPGLPSLPSWSWPTIPSWVWWVAGGILIIWLWPKDDRR